MLLTAINTAFAKETLEAAIEQWRVVADQLRVKALKRTIRLLLRSTRHEYLRRFHGFGPVEFSTALTRLGIRQGDHVLVHSAYDSFEAFTGTPADVGTVLCELVGCSGAVLMPTIPFHGLAVDYAKSDAVTDVRRTPSRMGIISEVFRRRLDVVRSVHPTHPVAIWSGHAASLANGHQGSSRPCGVGSPFHGLLNRGGKLLFLGTDIASLTMLHTFEELYEDRLPRSPFTSEAFRLRVISSNGSIVEVSTRLFDPDMAKRRRPQRLMPALQARHAWKTEKIGGMRMHCVSAEVVGRAFLEIGDRCYEP